MPALTTTAPTPSRDPALDGLRGLAVLLIYLFHYGGGLTSSHVAVRLFGMLTASGWIGVQIFFTLSGFLITTILWRSQHAPQPHRLRNFYARRALRILPLFYLALVAATLLTLVKLGTFASIGPLRPEFFFLQDIPHLTEPAERITALPLYHFWSLAVEEQFYVFWPLLLLACRTSRAALILCAAAFFSSWIFCIVLYSPAHLIDPQTAFSFNRFLLTNGGSLAAGAFVAIASPARLDRLALPALSLGLAMFLTSSLYGHSFSLAHPHQMYLALPGIWIASAALLPLALRPGPTREALSLTTLRFIGRISYGVYIFHLLLEPAFSALAARLTHATAGYTYLSARLCLALPLTLIVAWLSFQIFEFPFLNLKRHFP